MLKWKRQNICVNKQVIEEIAEEEEEDIPYPVLEDMIWNGLSEGSKLDLKPKKEGGAKYGTNLGKSIIGRGNNMMCKCWEQREIGRSVVRLWWWASGAQS